MNRNHPNSGILGPEPMTVLTDVLLAAAAIFFGARIHGVSAAPVHVYFALSFFLIALGTITGATIHAIRHTSLVSWVPLLWRITGIAVGTSVTAMLAATFYHILPADYADWSGGPFSASRSSMPPGSGATIASRTSLFFVLHLHGFRPRGHGVELRLDGLAGGEAHRRRDPHQLRRRRRPANAGSSWRDTFNHNDIYHVIQLVGLYFFYKGASCCSAAMRRFNSNWAIGILGIGGSGIRIRNSGVLNQEREAVIKRPVAQPASSWFVIRGW